MARLYAATGDGIARLDEAGGEWTVELFLAGSGAQCLAVDPADPNTVFAGLREGGVRRTTDGGRSWVDCALPDPGVFSLAVSAADGAVYAGTEPSRLFSSDDDGGSWRALDALLELPSHPRWSFPPRPWTSHVRWIAPSPHDADLVLVGIELGGLMRTTDGGEQWQALDGGLPEPLPSMPYALVATDGRLFAGLADGQLWESRDRGDTWSRCEIPGAGLPAV